MTRYKIYSTTIPPHTRCTHKRARGMAAFSCGGGCGVAVISIRKRKKRGAARKFFPRASRDSGFFQKKLEKNYRKHSTKG